MNKAQPLSVCSAPRRLRGPGSGIDTAVAFLLISSTNVFEHLRHARLSASLEGTHLGKSNSDPQCASAASRVGAPRVQCSPRREEAGGAPSAALCNCSHEVQPGWPLPPWGSGAPYSKLQEQGMSLPWRACGNNVFELLHIFLNFSSDTL